MLFTLFIALVLLITYSKFKTMSDAALQIRAEAAEAQPAQLRVQLNAQNSNTAKSQRTNIAVASYALRENIALRDTQANLTATHKKERN